MTLPEELAGYIRQQVREGRFESVSAFMAQATESMRDFEPLDLLVASMVAETGEPDERAEAWVESAMARARDAQGGAGQDSARHAA